MEPRSLAETGEEWAPVRCGHTSSRRYRPPLASAALALSDPMTFSALL